MHLSIFIKKHLFYGEFLGGGSRDLADFASIHVEAERYDLFQGEFSTGWVKRILQLLRDLLPVPERRILS